MTQGEEPGGTPGPQGLAVVALVLAVVSLLVPVLPGIVALALAVVATRRARQAPAAAAGGRGLVTAALALSTAGLLAWAGLGALAVLTRQQQPTTWQAAAATGTTTATVGAGQFSRVTAPPPTEPPATAPPATAPPATEPATTQPAATQQKAATGRVGDRLTVANEFGVAQLEITVTRLKFWAGDEFDQPRHGLFIGAFVKVHALADEQDVPWEDSYALVGGHHYRGDVITGSTAFDPPLDPTTLYQGEETAGWLVFDVPSRHGQLVLRDLLDERTLGIWKY